MSEKITLPILDQASRVNLIPTNTDHFEGLHLIFSDPETMRFMPTLPHQSLEQTQQHLLEEMNRARAQYWTIFLKNSNEPIGLVNMLGDTAIPGMGYILKRNYWHQGFITEACQQVIEFEFTHTAIEKIELWINRLEPVLITRDINESIHFYTEKLGFHLEFTYGEPINHAAVSWGDWSGAKVTLQISQAESNDEAIPYTQLYFFTDSGIDRLFECYKATGIEIVSALKDFPWGMREFAIRDPQGPLLRFGTHL